MSQTFRTEQEVALLLWVRVGGCWPMSPCPLLLDMRLRKLVLSLTGWSIQENETYVSPGQHSRTGPDRGDTGEAALRVSARMLSLILIWLEMTWMPFPLPLTTFSNWKSWGHENWRASHASLLVVTIRRADLAPHLVIRNGAGSDGNSMSEPFPKV